MYVDKYNPPYSHFLPHISAFIICIKHNTNIYLHYFKYQYSCIHQSMHATIRPISNIIFEPDSLPLFSIPYTCFAGILWTVSALPFLNFYIILPSHYNKTYNNYSLHQSDKKNNTFIKAKIRKATCEHYDWKKLLNFIISYSPFTLLICFKEMKKKKN